MEGFTLRVDRIKRLKEIAELTTPNVKATH